MAGLPLPGWGDAEALLRLHLVGMGGQSWLSTDTVRGRRRGPPLLLPGSDEGPGSPLGLHDTPVRRGRNTSIFHWVGDRSAFSPCVSPCGLCWHHRAPETSVTGRGDSPSPLLGSLCLPPSRGTGTPCCSLMSLEGCAPRPVSSGMGGSGTTVFSSVWLE